MNLLKLILRSAGIILIFSAFMDAWLWFDRAFTVPSIILSGLFITITILTFTIIHLVTQLGDK